MPPAGAAPAGGAPGGGPKPAGGAPPGGAPAGGAPPKPGGGPPAGAPPKAPGAAGAAPGGSPGGGPPKPPAGAPPGGAPPGGAPPGGAPPGGAPPGCGICTPLIIIVPLNLAGLFGCSSVPHATHWVTVSVLGLPQLGQKRVTYPRLVFRVESSGLSLAAPDGDWKRKSSGCSCLTRAPLQPSVRPARRPPRRAWAPVLSVFPSPRDPESWRQWRSVYPTIWRRSWTSS